MIDPRYCTELWQRYSGRLVLYAITLLTDRAAAEDVLQSVFARLWQRGLPSGADREAAYLFRAVRNEALNVRRSRRRAERRAFLVPAPEDPSEQAALSEWRRRVEDAVLSLPADEREAVVLRIWSDLSGPEAASVAGVTEKALEHRYYRGLAGLKDLLGDFHE